MAVKKRYIATAVIVAFFFLYSAVLLVAPRGKSSRPLFSWLAPPGAWEAGAALSRWRALADTRASAATRASVLRMKRTLAAAGLASFEVPAEEEVEAAAAPAPPAAAAAAAAPAPAGAAPLNVVLLAAPKLDDVDLTTVLASIAAHAPDALVLLIVEPAQAARLAGEVVAPGAAGGGGGVAGSAAQTTWQARAPLKLWLRMYSWDALSAQLPPAQAAYLPPLRRYAMYPLLLDDLAAGGGGGGGAQGALLFSNAPPALLRPPTGVLLSDARDVVLQADPFPRFHAQLGAGAGEAAVLVAGEARVMKLGADDWNRGWVSFCYYDLGEAMVNEEQIYCSGTTFGTPEGVRHYIAEGLLPAAGFCADLSWHKGMDQGIHNVLLHPYTPAQLAHWRARADAGGPFRPNGGKSPIMADPRGFLDLVERFQKGVRVRVAHAEEGAMCTMALLLRGGLHRDAAGWVLPAAGAEKCALVHQFDRSEELVGFYRKQFQR
jgi:hypothetical protein